MRYWLLPLLLTVASAGCDRTPGGLSGQPPSQEAGETSHGGQNGEPLFKTYCAACHQLGGQGTEGRVPPLDDSPWVSGPESRLIRIVLHGLHGPIEIKGETYNLEMPAFRMLFKDDDIAAVLTYVRQRYGAPSPPVTRDMVSRVRKETQNRTRYWTVEELMQFR